MKKLALIGAGGFVGSRFVELTTLDPQALRGLELVPVIRQPRGLARSSKLGGQSFRFADAAKPEELAKVLAGCDAAVNLTMGNDARIVPDLVSLHQACAIAKVPRLIHISSAEVYGRGDQPGLTDDSPWQKDHWMPYARAKGQAEDWLRAQTGGPAAITLRPGLIWGPRSPWVSGPAESILQGNATLVDEGRWTCNLCHVDTLVRQIAAVTMARDAPDGFYNVGDPTRPTWREYYAGLAAQMGVPDFAPASVAEQDFRQSFLTRLLALKGAAWTKPIKRALPATTKELWKHQLAILQRRRAPALATGRRSSVMPPKAMWWLQTTRYALPIEKFQRTFGVHGLPFAHGIEQTGHWLRFSGFHHDEA